MLTEQKKPHGPGPCQPFWALQMFHCCVDFQASDGAHALGPCKMGGFLGSLHNNGTAPQTKSAGTDQLRVFSCCVDIAPQVFSLLPLPVPWWNLMIPPLSLELRFTILFTSNTYHSTDPITVWVPVIPPFGNRWVAIWWPTTSLKLSCFIWQLEESISATWILKQMAYIYPTGALLSYSALAMLL